MLLTCPIPAASAVGALTLLCFGASAPASVIGANPPGLPLTLKRIETLPAAEQPAWKAYWERSARQREVDRAFLRNEERTRRPPTAPTKAAATVSRGGRGLPLPRAQDWYRTSEAFRIADIVLSYQTPAGGWSKNLDLTQHRRGPGESFGADNSSLYSSRNELDRPADIEWSYVGTFDNGATVMELRYLASLIDANPVERVAQYRSAFLHGLDYIFAAQYPNGGWPQVWPLQGGYHDAITYNDGAMVNILQLLRDISGAAGGFQFAPEEYRENAEASLKRGLDCLLATQIVINGHRTVWAQQHDALTLKPASARNYEMPSAAAGESAGIMEFLMQLPDPGSNVITAIDASAAWFKRTAIPDVAFRREGDRGRELVQTPGAGPLWARFYDIASDRPIFGDRDKTIHDDVSDISAERRNGYAWFVNTPQKALAVYVQWKKKSAAHPFNDSHGSDTGPGASMLRSQARAPAFRTFRTSLILIQLSSSGSFTCAGFFGAVCPRCSGPKQNKPPHRQQASWVQAPVRRSPATCHPAG